MENETKKRGRPPKQKEPIEASSVEQAGEQIVKRKRATPGDLVNASSAKSADVSRILSSCMNWFRMEKVKSAEELRKRTFEFFYTCIERGEIPTWEKYCLSTGYYRQTIWDWVTGVSVSELGPEANDIVKKAKEYLATFESELVTEGKVNPVVYIFRAKNYFGMKDQQEYVLTPNQPLGNDADATTIAGKYVAALPDTAETE